MISYNIFNKNFLDSFKSPKFFNVLSDLLAGSSLQHQRKLEQSRVYLLISQIRKLKSREIL